MAKIFFGYIDTIASVRLPYPAPISITVLFLFILPILIIGKLALWIAATLTIYTAYDYLKIGMKHIN